MLKLTENTKKFFQSTFIVLCISTLGGVVGYILNFGFFSFFLLFFIVQYILFSLVVTFLKSYFIEQTKQKELDKLENLSTILNCAYCNESNLMIFKPEDNNRIEFVCEHCKKKNLVTMQFIVARITEPVNIPKVAGIPLEEV
jgi:hypothetical protein